MNKVIKLSILSVVSLLMLSNNIKEESKEMSMIKDNNIHVLKITSTGDSLDHNKELAVDNDFNTYWMSEEKENQTLEIDLLEPKLINNITQIFLDEDIWFFKIEGSYDKSNYFELYDGMHG